MREPLVRLEGVSRVFVTGSAAVQAVDHVTVEIPRRVFFAFVGRSGSGKTTLLNLIGGLDKPTSGQVWVNGREISALSEVELTAYRRQTVGFVFQSLALLPLLSTFENVELPLRIAGIEGSERARRVRDVLDWVGLGRRAQHRPYELSGGEQQRVAIARALVAQPPLIIADEPTGELDTRTGEAILDLFEEIVRAQGATVLIATHDRAIFERTRHVHELVDGRLGQPGELAQVAQAEQEAVARTIFGRRGPWEPTHPGKPAPPQRHAPVEDSTRREEGPP